VVFDDGNPAFPANASRRPKKPDWRSVSDYALAIGNANVTLFSHPVDPQPRFVQVCEFEDRRGQTSSSLMNSVRSDIADKIGNQGSQFTDGGNIHEQGNVPLNFLVADFEFDAKEQNETLCRCSNGEDAMPVSANNDRQGHPKTAL
jgi:hypothetical protein